HDEDADDRLEEREEPEERGDHGVVEVQVDHDGREAEEHGGDERSGAPGRAAPALALGSLVGTRRDQGRLARPAPGTAPARLAAGQARQGPRSARSVLPPRTPTRAIFPPQPCTEQLPCSSKHVGWWAV